MKLISATNLDRKSGGVQWRDLRFSGPFLEMFFDRASRSRRRDLCIPLHAVSLLCEVGGCDYPTLRQGREGWGTVDWWRGESPERLHPASRLLGMITVGS
jgi:hypothetical protein